MKIIFSLRDINAHLISIWFRTKEFLTRAKRWLQKQVCLTGSTQLN